MPIVNLSVSVPVVKTARVLQLEGLFDVPPAERSERAWAVDLPLDDKPWQIREVLRGAVAGRPVAFASAIHTPDRKSFWREHRTVCLPDVQGVGIGNALSEFVASVIKSLGKPYMSTTGNPAMIRHRARSPLWKMKRAPSRNALDRGEMRRGFGANLMSRAVNRLTAGFEYVGPARPEDAERLGVVP